MPRAKLTPRDLDDADDHADESSVQRIVPAAGAARPASTAANSVFDAGRMAKAAATPPRIDADQIVIRKGVPKPAAKNSRVNNYGTVLAKMQPGDSVELPTKQARGFYSSAKKCGVSTTPPPAVQLPPDHTRHGRRVA